MSTAKTFTLTGADGRPYTSPVKGTWRGHHGYHEWERVIERGESWRP